MHQLQECSGEWTFQDNPSEKTERLSSSEEDRIILKDYEYTVINEVPAEQSVFLKYHSGKLF